MLVELALAADRTRLWLVSAAHVALAWRRDDDGTMVAEPPTLLEIAHEHDHERRRAASRITG